MKDDQRLLSLETKEIDIDKYLEDKGINPLFVKKIGNIYLVSISNENMCKMKEYKGKWKQLFDFIPSNVI